MRSSLGARIFEPPLRWASGPPNITTAVHTRVAKTLPEYSHLGWRRGARQAVLADDTHLASHGVAVISLLLPR